MRGSDLPRPSSPIWRARMGAMPSWASNSSLARSNGFGVRFGIHPRSAASPPNERAMRSEYLLPTQISTEQTRPDAGLTWIPSLAETRFGHGLASSLHGHISSVQLSRSGIAPRSTVTGS